MAPSRVALLLALSFWTLASAAPSRARVVFVGIDGASWNVIDSMLDAGRLPGFAALLARGASAELETVEPVISPVVWTSIASGRGPDAHGIGGFLATRMALAVPTAFERLAAGGVRVGLYEYLVTWPPPALPGGFAIPGWLRRDDAVWPPDVWTRAGVSPVRVVYDAALVRDEHAVRALREVERKPAAFSALVRSFDPELAVVTIYAVDRVCHRFWRDAYPDGADADAAPPAPGSVLDRVMRGLDRAVASIAAGLAPEDVLLVASDHGFQDGEARNVWVGRTRGQLARADLEPARDNFTLIREWGAIVARVHPGPFDARDAVLTRLDAFYRSAETPDGDALYRVVTLDAVERPPDHQRSFVERLRQRVYRFVAARFFGARFEEAAHGWVIAMPKEDAMASVWPDGRILLAGATLPAREVVYREDFDGEHDPTAVFVAAGGPIRPQPVRGELSALDLAPLLFQLTGQPIPDDLEGALPETWLDPDWLSAHPPKRVTAAEAPRLPASPEVPAVQVDDGAMLERLRALGYVD